MATTGPNLQSDIHQGSMMLRYDDEQYPARVLIDAETLDNQAIRDIELDRARHALAYLKAKIGNDAMRELLKDDLYRTAERCRQWIDASGGEWKSGAMELIVPGPSAETFHAWFFQMMGQDRQPDLRASHPEHFLNRPLGAHAEVIENVGQDDLPWHIKLDFTPPDTEFPTEWDPDYPVSTRLGAIINDAEGRRIGSAIHEMRDADDGLHIKLTIHLPLAAPDELIIGHLHHFSVEFRNWTRMALNAADG